MGSRFGAAPANNKVFQYELSTNFDISTATYNETFFSGANEITKASAQWGNPFARGSSTDDINDAIFNCNYAASNGLNGWQACDTNDCNDCGNISETTSLISLNVFCSTPFEQIMNIFFSFFDFSDSFKSIKFCLTD